MSSYIKLAKQIIEREYKSICQLSDVANKIPCSYNTLRSAFIRESGITLLSYLNIVRCKRAKYLIMNTDWKLYKIATEVGFSDEKYFSKVFKNKIGVYPSKFRRK